MTKKTISVVIPCHNEEKNIPHLIPAIIKNLPKKYNYEIILVDDGSKDSTFFQIQNIAKKNKKVKGIALHRNFGHQAALLAGAQMTKGNAVITMDADFQHPPELIPKITSLWEKGYDLVQMQKKEVKSKNIIKHSIRKLGYSIWEKVSGGVLVPGVSDFRLMDAKICEYLVESQERVIFLRGLTNLAARKPITIPYQVAKRKFGKSSYTFNMFVNMFINGFISFSTFPLRIAAITGFAMILISGTLLTLDIILATITHKRIIQGFTTLAFLIIILNGFLIFYMGIIGEYLGVIFKEVKKRPKFLIERTVNIK